MGCEFISALKSDTYSESGDVIISGINEVSIGSTYGTGVHTFNITIYSKATWLCL